MGVRASGILMPISSLPGKYGIGTLGKSAFDMIDFMKLAGQRFWQVLPLGHTGYGDSPYQCFSAFAGNPYMIDLDRLCEDGLLEKEYVESLDFGGEDAVDYGKLYENRFTVLRRAMKNASNELLKRAEEFAKENSRWLPDYALFMSLSARFGNTPLWEWPDEDVRKRDPQRLEYWRRELADDIAFYTFIQYLFYSQWEELKAYAAQNFVKIIGDIPIYVAQNSADIWAHPELFKLKEDLSPDFEAGVPPDYYSETGQLWGNPVYDWDANRREDYAFWMYRIQWSLKLYDIIRIDHFRGFCDYWEVLAGSISAKGGMWRRGPGMDLFSKVIERFGKERIIAEDLGIITQEVRDLLGECGFPGMRVMVFAFGGDDPYCCHLPHTMGENLAAYTSTHDSPPFRAVYESLPEDARRRADVYLGTDGKDPSWAAIRALWVSRADTAMTTMQDIMRLGDEGLMNRPSMSDGNWRWRAKKLPWDMADRLRELTHISGRQVY